MGTSPKSSHYNSQSIGLPLLQGNTDIKNRRSFPKIYTSEITKECFPEDILMSVRAPVGEISQSYHHACIGRGIAAIHSNEINIQKFIYQFLLWFEPVSVFVKLLVAFFHNCFIQKEVHFFKPLY